MITLFYQYYVPNDRLRRMEIDACIKNNIANKAIDKVMLYFEKESDMSLVPDNPKVIKGYLPERMTYAFWLKETEKLEVGEFSVLVNADIYFDESVKYFSTECKNINNGKMFVALTRYNPNGEALKLNPNPHWTQDAWGIVRSNGKFPRALLQETAFELGQPGCDNKIAYVMHSYGYTVTNPCYAVKSIHLQEDQGRSYDAKASKLLGLHAFVHPTKTVTEASKLEFDLLTRSQSDLHEIHLNNWINDRKSFKLIAELKAARLAPKPNTEVKMAEASPPASAELSDNSTTNREPAAARFEQISQFSEKDLTLLFQYSSRYKIFKDKTDYYFLDRYWPVVKIENIASIEKVKQNDKTYLFCRGFLPINLIKGAFVVADNFRHDSDYMFWQYPCITEKDAAEVHSRLGDIFIEDNVVHTYVGIPWATIIDRDANARAVLGTIGSRVRTAKEILQKLNFQVKVHSVCQHIFWRKTLPLFKLCEITDLSISHKELGEDVIEGVRLHPWLLYAVNYFDKTRRMGFENKKILNRKIFASFEGAYMKHYISDIRRGLKDLAQIEGYHIVIKDLWHFNKIVYNVQVKSETSAASKVEQDEVLNYNKLMSNSLFSLCPSGAGPNSLRLWECLANGSIPVLLSDRQELPRLRKNLDGKFARWEDALVIHPENDIAGLPARLKCISLIELERMQLAGQEVFKQVINMPCFGSSTVDYDRFAKNRVKYAHQAVLSPSSTRTVSEPVPAIKHKAVEFSLFKDQQIHCVGKTTSSFSGQDTLKPAVLEFKKGTTEFMLWFDKTERVSTVHVAFDGKPVNLLLQGLSKFDKLVSLNTNFRYQKPSTFVYEIDIQNINLCLGLKFSTKDELEAPVYATVSVGVFDNYYAEELKRLDHVGLLKSVSDANPQRKDHFFDTEHIDSGKILLNLQRQEKTFETTYEKLYPDLPPRTKNLVGEGIQSGITMYVHLMNRNDNVMKNLANWLDQKVDELILLDWSSTQPVAEIPGIYADPRVRVVRVEGQDRFIRTLAQNLATQMARNNRVFKLDSDVEFKGDFFANHPLNKGYFWVGNWMQGRDFNERHLHGETYYHLDDFFRVNGYDERIVAYGQDDTNLKDRMVLSGCERRVFSYNFLHHQHHDQAMRSDNQTMIHPMVRTYQNRFLTNHSELWSAYQPSTQYTALLKMEKYVVFEISAQARPVDVSVYESDAIDLIASWYLSAHAIKEMTREQKIQTIWECQVE